MDTSPANLMHIPEIKITDLVCVSFPSVLLSQSFTPSLSHRTIFSLYKSHHCHSKYELSLPLQSRKICNNFSDINMISFFPCFSLHILTKLLCGVLLLIFLVLRVKLYVKTLSYIIISLFLHRLFKDIKIPCFKHTVGVSNIQVKSRNTDPSLKHHYSQQEFSTDINVFHINP